MNPNVKKLLKKSIAERIIEVKNSLPSDFKASETPKDFFSDSEENLRVLMVQILKKNNKNTQEVNNRFLSLLNHPEDLRFLDAFNVFYEHGYSNSKFLSIYLTMLQKAIKEL